MKKIESSLCMGCMSPKDYDGPCRICGYECGITNPDFLPPATRLTNGYLVGKLLYNNHECAVYIGFDQQEDRKVFIREFMPQSVAVRNHANLSVKPDKENETVYKRMTADFQALCLKLKEISGIRGITQVLEVFEENNTVYAVYRYISMITLADVISRCGGEIKWGKCSRVFLSLLNTLSLVHKKGLIHAGISPQTILIDESGSPYLSLFSSCDEHPEGKLSDGYSAPEQYEENVVYGEWTDVYSIAAVIYRTITGTMPPCAKDRKTLDNLVSAAELDGGIPQNVSEAIRNAMLLGTADRITSADAFSAKLLDNVESNTAIYRTDSELARIQPSLPATGPASEELVNKEAAVPDKRHKLRIVASILVTTVLTTLLLGAFLWYLLNYTSISIWEPSSSVSVSEPESVSDSSSSDVPLVPDFKGKYIDVISSDEASDYSLWFDISTQYDYSDEYANGVIFEQSPPPGTPMPNHGNVILKVSKGPNTVKLPNLVGSTLELAIQQLSDMELAYQVIYVTNKDFMPGVVVETSPPADTEVRKNVDEILLMTKREEASSSEPSATDSESESSSNPYKLTRPSSSTPRAKKRVLSSSSS